MGRYEILDVLGRGGMGVVYRARDRDLDRLVALKCPHPEQIADEASCKRFNRTARLGARLTHGTIVTIFEVFEEAGVPWVAMELVEGESLGQRLSPGEPLPLEELLRHALDLATALKIAHAQNILHRDIKPDNIVLSRDGRAMLMDFGLAGFFVPPDRQSEVTTRGSDLTPAGTVMGTPGYMAPEQILGRAVDPRSDIFSLGTVLYEMATGRSAFARTEQGAAVDRVLHHEPEAIARLNYAAPEELERIIRKCLAKPQDERYQDADDLLADLRRLARVSGSQPLVPPRTDEVPRGRTPSVATSGLRHIAPTAMAILVAAAAVAAILWAWQPAGEGDGPVAGSPLRPSIALLPFEDQTGERDGALRAAMLADLLAAELSSRRLRALSSARVEEILAGAGRATVDRVDRVRRLANPDWLVSATLYKEGGSYQAAVSLHAVAGEEPKTSFRKAAATGSALVELIARHIEEGVFPGADEAAPPARTGGGNPASEEARLHLYRGRRALGEARYLEAIASFDAALAADPGLVPTYSWLARALHRSGFTGRALETARQGRTLAEQAGDERALLELRAVEGRIVEAIDDELLALGELARRHPDEPEILLSLATARRRHGEAAAALPVIEQALAVDPAAPRLHLEKAEIQTALGRQDEATRTLEHAESLFHELASRVGLAEVCRVRGRMHFQAQEFQLAAGQYRQAAEHYEASGHDALALSAYKAEGDMRLQMGDLEQARTRYDAALKEARRSGDFVLIIETLNSLGNDALNRGRMVEAERNHRAALDESRRLDNPRLALASLSNLSSVLGYTGKLGESRALAEEALDIARAHGDRRREAFALSRIGDAAFQTGDIDGALESYRTLVRLLDRPGENRARLATALASLAGVLQARENPVESRRLMHRALEMEREMDRPFWVAYYALGLGGIEGSLGQWEESQALLEESESIATAIGLTDIVPRIALVRARNLLLQGEQEEARSHVDRALREGRASKAVALEADASALAAQLALFEGKAEDAIRLAASAASHELALATSRVSARGLLAEAHAAAGREDRALSGARAVIDQADRLGMPLTVARAAAVVAGLDTPPPDAARLLLQGRAGLEEFLGRLPPDLREAVGTRRDIAAIRDALAGSPVTDGESPSAPAGSV